MCVCVTAGRAPEHPEADEGAAEEAESARPGERQPEERTQQGHPGPRQAGEPVQGAAKTQPLTQGTQQTLMRQTIKTFPSQLKGFFPSAGWRDTKDPLGGGEKEGGDFSFPGDAERHPESDGAAQREECQPPAGERRACRETEEAVWAIQAKRRGLWAAPTPACFCILMLLVGCNPQRCHYST